MLPYGAVSNRLLSPDKCRGTNHALPVHLNDDDFPEPHSFRPERFLIERNYPGTFGHSAFGWGRRVCPGMHLGSASVSINIARILWGFDVKPVKGAPEVDM